MAMRCRSSITENEIGVIALMKRCSTFEEFMVNADLGEVSLEDGVLDFDTKDELVEYITEFFLRKKLTSDET